MQKERNDFYVYIHRRASDNEVFYVGKGCGPRATQHTKRNTYWQRTAEKHGVIIEYVEKCLTENDAFDLEVELIKFYRDAGHPLTNLTDGGEGISGLVRTETHRQRISAAKMGHVQSEQTRKKMSENRPKTPVICSNGMMFESITDAANWAKTQGNERVSKGNIQNCCVGRFETCAGFRWRYIVDGVIDESKHNQPLNTPISKKTYKIKSVYCSNGMCFPSVLKAVEWLRENGFPNAGTRKLRNYCNKGYGTAYGFTWSFNDSVSIHPFSEAA